MDETDNTETPREYIARLRQEAQAALKRGEQLGFYDALATSRPSGEQAIFWMHPHIREQHARIKLLERLLMDILIEQGRSGDMRQFKRRMLDALETRIREDNEP